MTHLDLVVPLFIIVGIFVGILTMVYGLGGGIILVPFIYLYLTHAGFDTAIAIKVAVGTSLLNVLVATMSAAYRHHKKHNVVWSVSRVFLPSVVVGAVVGLALSHYLKGELLREIFIVFLIGIIVNSFFNKDFKTSRSEADFQHPAYWQMSLVGSVVGVLAILVGIGGGLLIIPYLRHLKMTMVRASATSASVAAIIALCGTLGYAYLGLHMHDLLPPYTIGYINYVIFIAIQLGAFVGIRLGEKVNAKMNDANRARWFPVLLVLMVILMLL